MLDDVPLLYVSREETPYPAQRDVAQGEDLLPAASFDSLSFQALEDAAIWTRAWVAIGFAADISRAGDVLPFTVGHHGIHVERLGDGSLVGRFNKAQHGGCRTVPLQCQTGAKTRCSFTACGYSYDRRPIAADEPGRARHLDQYLGLRPERLLRVDVRQWGPVLLARLDPRQEAEMDWPTPASLLPSGGFVRGATAWRELDANWKHLAPVLADAGEARRDAPLLFPNVVVQTTPDDTRIIILQPVALGRTLCRIRTASGRDAGDVQAQGIANLGGRDGIARTRFEKRVRAAIDRLAVEQRSETLFRTNDRGEW